MQLALQVLQTPRAGTHHAPRPVAEREKMYPGLDVGNAAVIGESRSQAAALVQWVGMPLTCAI